LPSARPLALGELAQHLDVARLRLVLRLDDAVELPRVHDDVRTHQLAKLARLRVGERRLRGPRLPSSTTWFTTAWLNASIA
jgi:hypothetical protein